MEMKKITGAIAVALGLSAAGASAAPMYIDLASIGTPGKYFFATPSNPADDGDDRTGTFTEFGFTQLLATSIYDFTDLSPLGSFTDTNIASELAAAGVPTSGTALDGLTPVSLVDPVSPGQVDIDALSPLAGGDDESFNTTWRLLVEYSFTGNLTASGPTYTGGTFDLLFDSLIDDGDDQTVLSGTLTGSSINIANLDLFFNVDSALDGFLWVENSQGTFVNAGDTYFGDGGTLALALDTNVNPPIPESDQLLLVGSNAIRQTTLDGSITSQVPSPGVLSLMGLGLLGFGAARKRKSITG
jgi:hypothetical protein